MQYLLEQAPGERKIIEQAFRQQMPLPNAIKNAPSLQLGLELYLEAWMDLNSCRYVGMSSGPIPWLAVQEWAMLYELDLVQSECLHYHIKEMDAEYFAHQKREAENG